MKRLFILLLLQAYTASLIAQCSICTKTVSQMGEEAGRGVNGGVLSLAAMPFAIMGYIAFKWWKNEKQA